MSTELAKIVEFIRAAKERQVADEFIVSLLRQSGWSERRIFQAFSAHYEAVLGTPVPTRGRRLENARDAFFYLLTFIALGFWTVALVLFADNYVDHMLPSSLDPSYAASTFRTQVAGQLATLIVSFPLFVFMSRQITLETARRPEAFESGVRKWLTYVALVITATTLLSDAVWFLSSFLTGDLTARFAWKAFVLFLVAAGIFWYYLGTVRAEAAAPAWDRTFGLAATASVAVALILGFTAIGTPARQRALTLDDRRVSRLSQIASSVHAVWLNQTVNGKNELPPSLTGMTTNVDAQNLRDPDTNRPFNYEPSQGASYRLCATFDAPNTDNTGDPTWSHPAGYYCYVLDARVRIQPIYSFGM